MFSRYNLRSLEGNAECGAHSFLLLLLSAHKMAGAQAAIMSHERRQKGIILTGWGNSEEKCGSRTRVSTSSAMYRSPNACSWRPFICNCQNWGFSQFSRLSVSNRPEGWNLQAPIHLYLRPRVTSYLSISRDSGKLFSLPKLSTASALPSRV